MFTVTFKQFDALLPLVLETVCWMMAFQLSLIRLNLDPEAVCCRPVFCGFLQSHMAVSSCAYLVLLIQVNDDSLI